MNSFLPFRTLSPATCGPAPRRMLGWLASVILLLAVPATTHAQTGSNVWLGAGLGAGTLFDGEQVDGEKKDDTGGVFSGALYVSYQSGVHVFSLRTAASGEFLFGDNFADVGVLYGRARTSSGGHGHASVSIGLALVFGERRCDGFLFACSSENGTELANEIESVVTVGLPIEAQLFWRPSSFIGLGLYGFANLNPEASFFGVTAGLQLGKFR